MKLLTLTATAALSITCLSTIAQTTQTGAIKFQHPYARATGPGQPVGGGYITLVNNGSADRLVSASADVSSTVQLHEMKMEGDVMRMHEVDGIALPAGGQVELKPGGYHIMFMGLRGPLKPGAAFSVSLKFEKAGEITVPFQVEALNGMKP